LLEMWLSKLEEQSFGVSGFRHHSHAFVGLSQASLGHAHKLMVRTGHPWPSRGGHRHLVTGYTIADITGHQHQLKGWTSPSEHTGSGHSHELNVATLKPPANPPARGGVKAAAVPLHVHSVTGSTTAL